MNVQVLQVQIGFDVLMDIPRIHLTFRSICKTLENDWNPGTWLLIWEWSVRAIQWIPTRHGLDGFQKIFASLYFGRT